MKARVQQWGNSLALRVPTPFAAEASLRKDSAVDVTVQSGKLVVTIEKPQLSREELVGRITPHNRHSEIETNGPSRRRKSRPSDADMSVWHMEIESPDTRIEAETLTRPRASTKS